MVNLENRQDFEDLDVGVSFKSALYNSLIFVGGGIALTFLILYAAYYLRL